ncbi:MAG: hypothetical protein H0U74_16125 [Bradymonadaceae bacterium]|nr:hypothetical protein [Lujinxingiaceae bacterium]
MSFNDQSGVAFSRVTRFKASILAFALLTLTVIAFSPSLGGEWLGDDFVLVVDSQCARGIATIPDILVGNVPACGYRGIRFVSYAIDYSLWGLDPFGYRLSNLVIHLGSGLLVFLLLLRLGIGFWWAGIGCFIFAVHPVQADSVAYISGRRDVLMGFWFFLSFWAATFIDGPSSTNETRTRAWAWGLLVALGAMLSMGTKEMGVGLAPVLLGFLALGGRRAFVGEKAASEGFVRRLLLCWWLFVPVLLLAGAVTIYRGVLNPLSTMANSYFGGTLSNHIGVVLSIHARYVELLFFPYRLAGDYAPPVIDVPSSLLAFAPFSGLLWLAALGALVVFFARKHWSREAFGIGWYLVTMLPVSHIIPHHEPAAEHYLYVPLFGLVLATTSLAQRYFATRASGKGRILLAVVAVALASTMVLRTMVRSMDYQGELSHAQATLRHHPDSTRAHARAGLALLKQDKFAEATTHLQFVLGTTFQGSARLDALNGLGLYYIRKEQYALALKPLEEFVSLRPTDITALEALGKVLWELGELERAHRVHLGLRELNPSSFAYAYLASLSAYRLGDVEQARRHIVAAVNDESADIDSLLLAMTLYGLDAPSDALHYLGRAKDALAEAPDENTPQRQHLIERMTEMLSRASDVEKP